MQTRIRQPTRRGSQQSQHIIPQTFSKSDSNQWPTRHVVLHPDDAVNKTFLALARCLSSVNNKAMTIKDLAEMVLHQGLVCQNVSAANQAITTFIRNHLQRCDAQQDQPLLLRHVLSGTASDDDLIPALHSLSGGAHCPISAGRATNFRKGTMVWYLSRVTGAPCPFARANIRLCDYGEDGRAHSLSITREQSVEQERFAAKQQTGQKRKRPLRGCVAKPQSDAEAPPPAKVKLTLRLKPLLRKPAESHALLIDSDMDDAGSLDELTEDDEDNVPIPREVQSPPEKPKEIPWSLPPYPRRSTISIPGYTPSSTSMDPVISEPAYSRNPEPLRYRSPSYGSPPPDSDYEDDDSWVPVTMTGARRSSSCFDCDADSEADTQWESPGPRSPSAPPGDFTGVEIKEETHDILASWQSIDHDVYGKPLLTTPELDFMGNVKIESLEMWSWEGPYEPSFPDWVSQDPASDFCIKEEQEEVNFPYDSVSPVSSFSELPLETPRPESSSFLRQRAFTVPNGVMGSRFDSDYMPPSSSTSSLSSLIGSMSMNSPTSATLPFPWAAPPAALHFASAAEMMAQAERDTICNPTNVSPLLVIQTVHEAENMPIEDLERQSSPDDQFSSFNEPPPLSATEQEMFLALCGDSDYPRCASPALVCENELSPSQQHIRPERAPPCERPLRRSKRVANAAVAAKSATTRARKSGAPSRKIAS